MTTPADNPARNENCDHWWRTIEEPGYGWISICEGCGKRESAEHSDACQFGMYRNHMPCICGAQEEFEKYEREREVTP